MAYAQPLARGMRLPRLSIWVLCVGLLAVFSLPVSVFGLVQLVQTTLDQLDGPAQVTDFLAYYAAARLVLHDAAHLYEPWLQREIQQQVQAGGGAYVPFVSPPHVPLLQAPLGQLPYGWAYAVWEALSLASVAASAIILAPRGAGDRRLWLLSVAFVPLFVPVQYGLIMGQSSALMLLGFSVFARLSLDAARVRGSFALLSWSLKPNLLPVHVAALVGARQWRMLRRYAAALLVLLAGAIGVLGIDGARGFVQASTTRVAVAAVLPDGHPEGLTLLVIAQAALGVGTAATIATLISSGLCCVAVGWVWRGGLAGTSTSRGLTDDSALHAVDSTPGSQRAASRVQARDAQVPASAARSAAGFHDAHLGVQCGEDRVGTAAAHADGHGHPLPSGTTTERNEDSRRYVQLALLPIAATLASVHAGVYELTTWLASVWLLLEYARLRPERRGHAFALILAIWIAGDAGVIGQTTPLLPAVACLGVLVLLGVLWLYATERAEITRPSQASRAAAPKNPR